MKTNSNIYGLFDPRYPDVVMYVGKGSEKRAQYHWYNFCRQNRAINSLVRRWFNELKKEGVKPSWRFLEENVLNWQEREIYWISYWKSKNINLCNIAKGGNTPLSTFESCSTGGKTAVKLGRNGFTLAWKNNREAMLKIQDESRKKQKERKVGFYAPNAQSKAGKAAAKSGRSGLAKVWKTKKDEMLAHAKKASKLGAKAAKAYFKQNPEECKRKGQENMHLRWHVKCNKPNPECQLCRPEFFDLWEGGHA